MLGAYFALCGDGDADARTGVILVRLEAPSLATGSCEVQAMPLPPFSSQPLATLAYPFSLAQLPSLAVWGIGCGTA